MLAVVACHRPAPRGDAHADISARSGHPAPAERAQSGLERRARVRQDDACEQPRRRRSSQWKSGAAVGHRSHGLGVEADAGGVDLNVGLDSSDLPDDGSFQVTPIPTGRHRLR